MSNLGSYVIRVFSAIFGDKKKERMRMKNKSRKSTTFHFNAGSRCGLYAVILVVVGFIFVLHLITTSRNAEANGELHPHISQKIVTSFEEENIQMPPRRNKPARSPKGKHRRFPSYIEEFLDENSKIRHVFFPDESTAIDPRRNTGNESFFYFPGRIWLDTDGNPIHAHGGGILFDEKSGLYYWYGEYKDGPTYHAHKKAAARVDVIGVGCYSSRDLWTWKNEGIVLQAEQTNATHDLHKSNVLERPKVIYNDNSRKYVMWMHIDDVNYTKAAVGVAVSDHPTGPFHYLYSKRPHGFDSRDMTVFKDDDGVAYLIYSSENNHVLHIGPLTGDYLDVMPVMKRVLIGQRREAPALFKHQGTYYMISSGCSGWAPNEALTHSAKSIMGPWEMMGNPCIGGNKMFQFTTFFAQSTFVLPIPGYENAFIFMADRWNPADLRNSRYVWLPLIVEGKPDYPLDYEFGFPSWSRVSIYWHRMWKLPHGQSEAYLQ